MTIKTSTNSLAFDLPANDTSAATVPDLVQLLPASGFVGRDGRGPYTFSADTLLAAFAAFGMPLPIDYEHQSLTAADKHEPTPAAGWINELVPMDDGTLWGRVEWTDQAREFIAAREYRYLSPVFSFNTKTSEVVQMLGAGLTNNPNLYLTAFNSRGDSYTDETTTIENIAMTQEQLNALLAALGLPEGTAPEALAAHAAGLVEQLATAATTTAAQAEQLETSANTLTTAQADLALAANAMATLQADLATSQNALQAATDLATAANARAEAAESALAALQADQLAKSINAAVQAAVSAGKITPAQVEFATTLATADLAAFSRFVETAAPVLGAAPATADAVAVSANGLTDEQRQICKAYGFDEKAFAKALATQNNN